MIPEHIQKIAGKLERQDPMPVLSLYEIWQLLVYECERGGMTVDELLEYQKTRIWPSGKCNILVCDAEMLLGMVMGDMERSSNTTAADVEEYVNAEER